MPRRTVLIVALALAGAVAAAPTALGAGAPACHKAQLSFRLGRADHATSHTFWPLIFTNVSGRACTLTGFPGVSSVIAPHARQVGRAAAREPGFKVRAIRLAAHGGTASAVLTLVNVDVFDRRTCRPRSVGYFRVFAPNQTAAFFRAKAHRVCTRGDSGQSVRPVVAGKTGL
jgi:Protein of unknown function (DUF4232)